MITVKMLSRTHFAELGAEVQVSQDMYDSYGPEYMEILSQADENEVKPLTKKQLSEKLTELGVEHDPKATNPVLEELLAKALATTAEGDGKTPQADENVGNVSTGAITGAENTAMNSPEETK
jgi:hypothetical protein